MKLNENLSNSALQKFYVMSQQISLILSLIEDIMDVAKLEQGIFQIANENFSMNEFLQEIYSIFQAQAKDKGIKFTYTRTYGDQVSDLIVMSDRKRLKQVLINLISNCLKFTVEGEIKVKAMLISHGRVSFKVTDTGVGMSEECLRKMFSIFNQCKEIPGINT